MSSAWALKSGSPLERVLSLDLMVRTARDHPDSRHSGAACGFIAGRTRKPSALLLEKSHWVPGSIADEAGDGPGMTKNF